MASSTEKKTALQQFAQKALQRLEAKKTPKTATLFIPSIEQKVTIRSLTTAEIKECYETEDNPDDMNTSDKYSVYLGMVEPSLTDVAKELRAQGQIQTYLEVVDMFELHEITSMSKEIMKLSGVIADDTAVKVVEDIKN